jgi:hypothetical protein
MSTIAENSDLIMDTGYTALLTISTKQSFWFLYCVRWYNQDQKMQVIAIEPTGLGESLKERCFRTCISFQPKMLLAHFDLH